MTLPGGDKVDLDLSKVLAPLVDWKQKPKQELVVVIGEEPIKVRLALAGTTLYAAAMDRDEVLARRVPRPAKEGGPVESGDGGK